MSGCYGDYLEWLSSSGLDTSYADNGINPYKDHRETEEDDCDQEDETDGE